MEPGGYPYGCPDCAGSGEVGRLEVVYDYPDAAVLERASTGPDSMWRYRELLPLLADEPVTLGEGRTPLVPATSPSIPDAVDLRLKNETVNPTWSYKDRLNSLLVSNAVALGERHFATASTGNHGASTAAYAARAGAEETIVLIPPDTETPHRVQLRAYGATVAVTAYDARSRLLERLVDRGWYPTVSVVGPDVGLPYSYEAYKTIAFELVEELGGPPSAVTVPIGAGDGLYGVWKGFRELHEMGVIDSPPRMYGVQPAERPSVVRALAAGSETVEPVSGPMPVTTSTSGPTAGDHALRAIRESGGDAYAIDRADVLAAIRTAGRDAVFVEPASALSLAGAERAWGDGAIDDDETVVCLATGAGVKWPDHCGEAVDAAPEIDATLEALANELDVEPAAPQGR